MMLIFQKYKQKSAGRLKFLQLESRQQCTVKYIVVDSSAANFTSRSGIEVRDVIYFSNEAVSKKLPKML